MKRRASERGISTEDLASKQRIVRRKRRTPSPDIERVTSKTQREVRTSGGGGGITTSSGAGGGVASGSGGLYTSKYASKYEQRSHKTDSQIREERLGTKYDSYNPASGGGTFRSQTQQDPRTERHHHHGTNAGGVGGGGTGAGGGHHHPSPHHNIQHTYVGGQGERFEYSLRVGNLDFKMHDHELKKALFNKFKKFGYVNIKLLGNGKERHAFINFARENDARTALADTQECTFQGHMMDVNWSRSTLHRFPDLLSGGHNEPRSTVLNAKRRLLGPVPSRNSRSQSRSRSSSPMTRRGVTYKEEYHHHHQSPRDGRSEQSASSASRATRDISYRTTTSRASVSISPPPIPTHGHSHERGVASHMTSGESRHSPAKTIPSGGTIVDSNATRTLFVGNLEYDITERELRDLFGPYGRIESVDIKSTRQTNSAYAFVKFFTITDAINAKNDIHGRQYGNFRLKIGFGKGNPSIKVWIGGISCFADLTEIRQELDRFGLIRKVEYVKGDNHAIVHFDSMDAAQTAVNSLQEYRFRSTNRHLKIDILTKSLAPHGSEFDDFEIEVISPTSSRLEPRWTSNKSTNSRGSTTDLTASGGVSGGENYRRRITREDSRGMDQEGGRGETHYHHHQQPPPSPEHTGGISARNGRGSLYAGSENSERNRIVSESANSGSRSNEERRSSSYSTSRESRYSGGTSGKFERGGGGSEHAGGAAYRKRPRSPSMNEEEHFNSSTIEHHYNRRHSANDDSGGGMGGADVGGVSFNGGSEFRSKKPRNSFDAYKYHKLYGNRSAVDDGGRGGGAGSRYGSAHYDREKDHHHHHHADSFPATDPREHHTHRGGGDHRDYHRDDRGRGERGGGERERDRELRERERRDRHMPSSIKDDPRRESNDRRDSTTSKDGKKDPSDDAKKNEKEASAPPAVPPPPPVLISNDNADTALKLNNSSDAPTGNGVTTNSNMVASSVETISDLAKLFPIAWKGTLVLKNTGFPTRMHLIGGDPTVVELLVRSKEGKDEVSSLRITQRLRLEPPRLEEVNKRMASAGPSGHCILLALAGPTPSQSSGDDSRSDTGSVDLNTQLRPLKSLVSYLKQKEAAGIVALSGPEKGSVTSSVNDNGERDNIIGVLHAFPPCEFSQKQLLKIAPHLGQDTAKEDHIVVLLVKGTV